MKGSVNGRIVDDLRAGLLSPLDRGILYGDGLYETMRVREGRIEFQREHIERIRASARELRLSLHVDAKQIATMLTEVVRVNGGENLALRMTITRGIGGERLGIDGCNDCTTFVTASRFTGYTESLLRNGIRLAICPFPRNEHSPLTRHKTICCLESVLARDGARRAGADDALFLNGAGRMAETTVANLFLVRDGVLITPSINEGVLPGIMRKAVLRAATRLDLLVEERPVDPGELFEASELFLTNSLLGLGRVGEIDQRRLPQSGDANWLPRLQDAVDRLAYGDPAFDGRGSD